MEATLSSKNHIVTPKEAREALGVKPGNKVLVVLSSHGVILLKKPGSFARALTGLAKGAYPTDYLEKERVSWEKPTPTHCCADMDQHLADGTEIRYSPNLREYGIPITDGGTSFIRIYFCPWCGTRLPPDLRDEWFEILQQAGLDPWVDELPSEFTTDEWWRKRAAFQPAPAQTPASRR